MQSGIFLASQISINIPAPGFGNRGRCNLKGEELERDTAPVEGPALKKSRLEMIFDQLLPFNLYFVKCTMDTAFKRTNYSMVQREYSQHLYKPVS